MGKKDYLISKEKQIEALVLIIFTLYSIFVIYCAYIKEWNSYIQLMNVGALIYPWILFVGRYLTYRKRAYITTIMCVIMLMSYDFHMENLLDLLTTFVGLVTLVALYGIPKILSFMAWAYTVIIGYYVLYRRTMGFGDDLINNLRTGLLIITVYVVVFIVHYMVKRNEENRNSMLEMIDALQQSERIKDDFLANVSHEIRTPVNTICGISEIILNTEVPEHLYDDLFGIQTAGKNLISVVSDILDFSELQNEDFDLIEENYYISSTIYDVINLSMAKKPDTSLQFIVDCDANLPSILIGDEQKIRRVIMNIVDNAIKFTSEGCVRIRITYRKEEYGINLIVSVKDTGIGMSEENIETVFEEFTQMDMSRTRVKGGVGLGLAISKAIVHKMGGFFTAKSQLGKGTEIQFVIPQKVFDDTPIAQIEDIESINAMVYINMEQFYMAAIRDEYAATISHMMNQLGVKCHLCRNLAELKRREKHEKFSHYFISMLEYLEDPQYFDTLSKRNNVSIIIEAHDDIKIRNKNLNRIFKPFFVLSIVAILNSKKENNTTLVVENEVRVKGASDAHILIVDDNRMNIRVVEGLLAEYKIKTSFALSGKEALDMVRKEKYDLIFMDHMMPEMDGVECFHHIRAMNGEYYQEVPIVALTANAIAGAREMFMKEGFDDFVAKPVESSVLLRTLKRHIQFHETDELVEESADLETNTSVAKVEQMAVSNEPVKASVKESKSLLEELGAYFELEKGILYCGTEKNYIQILASHKESGRDNMKEIEALYQAKDWKNYTVSLHGTKSSMMSIGAVKLSEMAKELELAGKRDDIEFICEHHEAMLKEYETAIGYLENSPLFASKEKTSEKAALEAGNKTEITEEQFQEWIKELEDGAYSLNADAMKQVMVHFEGGMYKGVDLENMTSTVQKKIEMADFFSAYETVVKAKEKCDKA